MKHLSVCLFCEREKTLDDLSLSELEDKVFEITKKQNYISNCDLSEEVTSLALKELQEKKIEIKAAMHRKIESL